MTFWTQAGQCSCIVILEKCKLLYDHGTFVQLSVNMGNSIIFLFERVKEGKQSKNVMRNGPVSQSAVVVLLRVHLYSRNWRKA